MGYEGEDGGPEREAAFHPRNTGTEAQPIYFIAEYPAAHTTNPAEYTDLRSGATVVGEGWPVFGCLGYSGRPIADYIHWIGMYSDDRAPNNKLWGGEATISGCWGRGHYSSFRLCRLIRGNDLEQIGADFDNKCHFRIDHATHTTFSDNHLSIVDCQQAMNNTCWTVYQCSFMTIHNNTCVSTLPTPMCMNIKAGVSRGRPIEGIRFFNNRIENFAWTIHCTGATKETEGEYYRSHFYGNLAIGGKTFFAWNLNDDYGYSTNGLRLFNNTIVNMTSNTESAAFSLSGRHDKDPQWNPRDITMYNNISYNTTLYMMTPYATDKDPKGFPWMSQFSIWDRNCAWGYTKLMRSGLDDPQLNDATWETWTSYIDADASSKTDQNGLNADPEFADTVDYRLSPESPCATLGRDYYGFYGPVGATIPAGCYVTGSEIIGIR
jgi:hypothetical protein